VAIDWGFAEKKKIEEGMIREEDAS